MNAHPMQHVLESMPFAAELGIELDSATPEQVAARLAWAPKLCTTGGLMHGGALMAFADSIGGLCAFLNLPEGAGTATISSSTNFLRAVRGGVVHGTARRIHAGRTVIVVQTELTDDSGQPAAQVTQAQAVIPPR
jgi:1,4-dihydroxy-2-naphthoyl-CoA hydrolase